MLFEPFPVFPLLFEEFPFECLFLLESDTPTPTPMAMSAARPTSAPMSYGSRIDQYTRQYMNELRRWRRTLGIKGQDSH